MTRPYVIVNVAISLDGKIALGTHEQTRLSNNEDFARVHNLRNSVDAILVGINTILQDDPALTVKSKYVNIVKNPIRIVLDSTLKIPVTAKVFNRDARTIIVTTEEAKRDNINFEVMRCGKNRVDLQIMLEKLYNMGIRSIMVEGGGTVIYSFLKKRLVDELLVFIAPVVIGADAPSLANGKAAMNIEEMINLKLIEVKRLGNGIYCKFKLVEQL